MADVSSVALNVTRATSGVDYSGYCGHLCRLILYPIIITVWVIAMTTNFFILISSFWLKRKPSPNLMLCISLVAADTWASFINIQFLVVSFLSLLRVQIFILNFCVVLCLSALLWASSVTCVFHLVGIAMNHLWGTMFPFKHKLLVTSNVVRAGVIVLWLTPLAIYMLIIGSPPDKGLRLGMSIVNVSFQTADGQIIFQTQQQECDFWDYQFFSFRLGQTVPIASAFGVTVSAYVYILLQIQKRSGSGKLSAAILCQYQNSHVINRRRSTATEVLPEGGRLTLPPRHGHQGIKTTLLITGTFALGWLPICLSNLLICPHGCPVNNIAQPDFALIATTSTYVLIIIKHMCNAAIYALRIPEIRQAVHRMRFQCFRHGVETFISPMPTLLYQRRETIRTSSNASRVEPAKATYVPDFFRRERQNTLTISNV